MLHKTKQLILSLGILLVIAITLIFITGNSFTSQQTEQPTIPSNGEITLQGKVVCLPHKDTSGPQTLECAFGFQDTNGNYYALKDTDPTYSNVSNVPMDIEVEIHGQFTRQDDDRYASVGVISLDDVYMPGEINQDIHSDGVISFSRPSDFGLAVTAEQVLVKSYIPPCDPGFLYCLYYNGDAYTGTNFESAGLSISKRFDLANQNACLTTKPDGYTNLAPKILNKTDYSISVFKNIGDAGAGHYATGEEYRLFTNDICYQFDIRVGETQYANYPEGSITKFTDGERTAMLEKLRTMIRDTKLEKSSITITLP